MNTFERYKADQCLVNLKSPPSLRFVLTIIAPYIVCSIIENRGRSRRSILEMITKKSQYFLSCQKHHLTILDVHLPVSLMKQL